MHERDEPPSTRIAFVLDRIVTRTSQLSAPKRQELLALASARERAFDHGPRFAVRNKVEGLTIGLRERT